MKKSITVTLLMLTYLIISKSISAQESSIKFDYDLNGNRITRTIKLIKSDNQTDNGNAQAIYQPGQAGEIEKFTEQLGEHNISIFPNPTVGTIFIETQEPVKNLKIELTDLKGNSIQNYNLTNDGKLKLDLSGNSNGIYLLKLSTDAETKVWKIIKQ